MPDKRTDLPIKDTIFVRPFNDDPTCGLWYDEQSEATLVAKEQIKYHSESYVQQLIKEAEARQRERCDNAYIDWVTGVSEFNDPHEAILNATGDE